MDIEEIDAQSIEVEKRQDPDNGANPPAETVSSKKSETKADRQASDRPLTKDEAVKSDENLQDRIKSDYNPIKVDETHFGRLIEQLKKENCLRPKSIFHIMEHDRTMKREQLQVDQENDKDDVSLTSLQLKEKEGQEINEHYKMVDSNKAGRTVVEEPLAVFNKAQKAYIDQFYKISDMLVTCPLYFNYRISLEYDQPNEQYYLFDTKEISAVCSHNCCPNQMRQIDIDIINFLVGKNRKPIKCLSLKKEFRCACSCLCACCSRPRLNVRYFNQSIGNIVEENTICDPVLKVYDHNNEVKYEISGGWCQCGFCCPIRCGSCCNCDKCIFEIYGAKFEEGDKTILGSISKEKRSGRRRTPDYEQVEIKFPDNASCEDKCLLVCAGLLIEYLYFQNYSSNSRCNGNPHNSK